MAKGRGLFVQSTAEALKPEHGLETLAILNLEQPPPNTFSLAGTAARHAHRRAHLLLKVHLTLVDED